MLKHGLIKEIRLYSSLFHSLPLWPEASGLTSVYLLAMTKMSKITFFPFIFLSALPLGILHQGMFFHFDFSPAESAHTSTELPVCLLLHTLKATCCTGKSSFHNKSSKLCDVYK